MADHPPTGRSLWVDISTLQGWKGNPTGIARTLGQLVRHWHADPTVPLRFCARDPNTGAYQAVDWQPPELAPASQGEEEPEIRRGEETPAGMGSSSRVPSEWLEARWHLQQAGRNLGRLGKAVLNRAYSLGRKACVPLRRPAPAPDFQPDDVLFLAGAGWKDSPGPHVCQDLRKRGVRIVQIIYDITPLRCPYWCAPGLTRAMEAWLPGVLAHSDRILTISQYSRKDLQAYIEKKRLPHPPIDVIRLGDEPGRTDDGPSPMELPGSAAGPFALYVSTLGLNKNHALLFDVWRRLIDRHGPRVPTLVLVGQPGWKGEQTLHELASDPILNRHICHLPRTNDRQLRWLYRRCLFTLYPSHYEGWGLPVAESLASGKACICSNASSLPEVGGNLVDYHDPMDGMGCYHLVEKAMREPGWLREREQRIRREYRPYSWAESARMTRDLLVPTSAAIPTSRPQAA